MNKGEKTIAIFVPISVAVIAGMFGIMQIMVDPANSSGEIVILADNKSFFEQTQKQQTEMIKSHIASKINNVVSTSTNLTIIIRDTYSETKSVDETIDSLRESGLFHVNTPVPKEIAYFYVIDNECNYRLYAYDDENINRSNATGTETCDELVHEKGERKILTKNYASTSTFNFVNTFGRSIDLDNDGNVDLVLGVAINWDNISSEIKNMIFLDDMRYMLKDKNDVIVINATKLSFSSLHVQANDQAEYNEHKEKNLLDPNSIAVKFEVSDNDILEQLDGISVMDDNTDLLVDWVLITRAENDGR